MLRGIDAVYVSTVFEDTVDELNVLGNIMPYSFENRADAGLMVSDEIKDIIDYQNELESRYEQAMLARIGIRGALPSELLEMQQEIMAAAADLKNSTQVFARNMKQSPLTPDNLQKVQEDRCFLEQITRIAYQEILKSGSFDALNEAVKSYQDKREELQNIVIDEEDSRKQIKQLRKQIDETKKERIVEVQSRNEMIAHLKDQLQEMKGKTNMEGKYIKKCADVAVSQTLKKCSTNEQLIKDDIEALRRKIDEEMRVNAETESWLRSHQQNLEQKVDFWMEKHEKDVEKLQRELDILKASKAKDLSKLEELTKTYKDYKAVVVEDRIEKEKERRRKEQEAIELSNSLKIQSWFRTVMVQKGLGPYGKKKKKKGKKGKKSGKKGGKKSGKKGKKKK